ncbi:MAG: terminase family protein [Pseudomonadota bacterium]
MDAQNDLIAFTEYTFPQYQTAAHHRLIASKLEEVERGEIDRLMIFMPPRHGKSELATKRFPAWALGRNPRRQIIQASYNSDLATDFGRQVRNIVGEQRYQNVFDTTLASDSKAANRWNTSGGGAYVAAGVGTAVTGRGADIFIIDDPLKDREEADSETRRETIWNWYTSTAYTRLMKGGAVILIQTRWHEDDLAGRLLEAEAKGGDKWHKLILPANGDHGPLWPEMFDGAALERIQAAIGPRDWSALYQQSPAPEDGTFFKREWFKRHSVVPRNVSRYLCSDYAVSEKTGDFTEHGMFAIAPNNTIYVEDWWHGQTSSDVWIETKLDLVDKYKPFCAFGEGGVIQKAVEPMLMRRMRERESHCRVEWVSSIHDKPSRARAIQARAAMGHVSLPEGPIGDRLLSQLLSFPAGKHDDAVDVFGLMGRVIDQAHPAFVEAEPKPVKQDRWRNAFNRNQGESDWKTL